MTQGGAAQCRWHCLTVPRRMFGDELHPFICASGLISKSTLNRTSTSNSSIERWIDLVGRSPTLAKNGGLGVTRISFIPRRRKLKNHEHATCYVIGCEMPIHKVTKLVNKASLCDFFCTPDENADPSDIEGIACSMHGHCTGN